jgi:hypothetical protein
MLALYFIIAGSLALLLITPAFLFAYLSLEPHLRRRRLRAAEAPPCESSAKTLVPAPGFRLRARAPRSMERQA